MYLNKAIIIGNLTRDPELRSLPSGVKVCSFALATNRGWEDKTSGEKKYRTEIVAERTQFGPKGAGGGAGMNEGAKVGRQPEEADSIEYPEEDINPEDIPF